MQLAAIVAGVATILVAFLPGIFSKDRAACLLIGASVGGTTAAPNPDAIVGPFPADEFGFEAAQGEYVPSGQAFGRWDETQSTRSLKLGPSIDGVPRPNHTDQPSWDSREKLC